jgi:fimbrial chaperone protein
MLFNGVVMIQHGPRPWLPVVGLILSIALLVLPTRAQAGALSISPVRITLAAGTTSGLMTVRNESPDPVRLQLTLHTWLENPDGTMQLAPTEDLVVFPGLLQLKPNESRKVRIGLPAQQDIAVEKTYRVFLEELPGSSKPDHNQVRVLARIGVPIFLQPREPKPGWAPAVSHPDDKGFSLQLKNTGNVHLILQEVTVRGIGLKDQTIFDQTLTGGYLLADSVRTHVIKVPLADRAKLTACQVHLVTPDGPHDETVACPPGLLKQ